MLRLPLLCIAMLILASTSARRRELIQLFGLGFKIIPISLDESPRANESAQVLVQRLSLEKATLAARDFPNALVVAADTVVELDGRLLGKPQDLDEAVRMLKLLRGREHTVYSGLATMRGTRQVSQIAKTTVRMRDYSDAQIDAYVATNDPLDKAAAYAIQHTTFQPVAQIEGCYANVMGLPLCHLYLALKNFGIPVNEPDRVCQGYLKIVCPVAREILEATNGPSL